MPPLPPRPPRPPPGAEGDLAEDAYTDRGYSEYSDFEERLLVYEERMVEYEEAQLDYEDAVGGGGGGGSDAVAALTEDKAAEEQAAEEKAAEEKVEASQAAALSRSALEISDEFLGEGATAQVYRGWFGAQRLAIAAKVAHRDGLDDEDIQCLRDEIAIQRSLAHRNVCRLLEAFEDGASFTMVLQLCAGGSLVDSMVEAVEDGVKMKEAAVKDAGRQMLSGLAYCHAQGVYHRDVKMANLCWVDSERTWLVLTDFGYASRSVEHGSFVGSAHFAAPELHHLDSGESTATYSAELADMWAAGVVIFAMLAMQLPFGGEENTDEEVRALRAKICACKFDVPLVQLKRSNPAKELLKKMVVIDPRKRLRAQEALAHGWCK